MAGITADRGGLTRRRPPRPGWLPHEEAAQLRLAFETAVARLERAA